MTDYFISTQGSDLNSGLSPTAPWETLHRLQETEFCPGDRIGFRRGDTWESVAGYLHISSTGTECCPITYRTYGAGDKPLIKRADGGQTVHVKSQNHIILQDLRFESARVANSYASISVQGDVTGLVLDNCETDGDGIYIPPDAHGNAVVGCKVSNCPGDGIVVQGPDNVVEYNEVCHCGEDDGDTSGITINGPVATGNVVRFNTAHHMDMERNIRGIIVDFVPGGGTLVFGNIVYECATGISSFHSPETLLIGNVVYNGAFRDSDGRGIECSGGADRSRVLHNVVFDCGDGLYSQMSSGCEFGHNIVLYNKRAIATALAGAASHKFDHNCYHNPGSEWRWDGTSYTSWEEFRTASGQETHGRNADPRIDVSAPHLLRMLLSLPAEAAQLIWRR